MRNGTGTELSVYRRFFTEIRVFPLTFAHFSGII